MASMLLPIVRDNAYLQLAEYVPKLLAGNYGEDGRNVEVVVQHYRRAGICSLLHDLSIERFHSDLQKAAAAYAHCLPNLNIDVQSTSRSSGFYCAAACGDSRSAREIAQNSRDSWNPDLEHEDDFVFTRFLMDLFYLAASEQQLQNHVESLESITDGEFSSRLGICKAMLDKSADDFDDSFGDFLTERSDFVSETWDEDHMLEEEWATDGQIYVEGIAIAKLASKLSIKTQPEFLFVPSMALEKSVADAPPASWQSVDS